MSNPKITREEILRSNTNKTVERVKNLQLEERQRLEVAIATYAVVA